MDIPACVAWAPIITFLIQLIKPRIAIDPRILAIVGAAVTAFLLEYPAAGTFSLLHFVGCAVLALIASVGTYELIVKPVVSTVAK